MNDLIVVAKIAQWRKSKARARQRLLADYEAGSHNFDAQLSGWR